MRLLPDSLNAQPEREHRPRSGADVVGLDIQPGFVAAVRARVNGSIMAERAATLPLPADTVRDGEVMDQDALGETLRELFAGTRLGKRVRVGVANQRTVLRTLELPPVTDHKELAAAVRFQAQEQVPMPLSNAVLDFHPLGIVDTPAGPRQRVVLVAAQRDMVERLLQAVRQAGLNAEGVDLSAFALIRSLYRPDADQVGRILYLNVDGLTNLAIAEGPICRFTRVVGSGLEGMAVELAERRSIPLVDARGLLAAVDLRAPAHAEEPRAVVAEEPVEAPNARAEGEEPEDADVEPADEQDMSYEELTAVEAPASADSGSDADVLSVVESGIRDISGEVRNSLDFHRSQEGGGEVSHVVLSGSVQDIPGFAEALESALGVPVHSQDIGVTDASLSNTVATHRLSVAAGLAATEVAMRAVNLIPAEQRGGAAVGAGRSEGGAYAVLGLLAGIAVLALLYGMAHHQISSRRSEIASVTARAQQAQSAASQLAPYTSFISLREQRTQAVAQLVDSRFDWAHVFHEFGRVLPVDVSISSLTGTIGATAAAAAAAPAAPAASATPASSAASASAPVASVPAARERPPFTLAGCAPSRARGRPDARAPASDRRRRRGHAAELDQGRRRRLHRRLRRTRPRLQRADLFRGSPEHDGRGRRGQDGREHELAGR